MSYIERELAPRLLRAARDFPAVVLSGPRRSGKTFLLRKAFAAASYHLLEDPDVVGRVRADPRGWLEDLKTPAILDEIQNVPEILPYVRTSIDRQPEAMGRWLLTGSHDFALMKGVSESMAGRAAIFQLLPLSIRETGDWSLLRGGFPEVVVRPGRAEDWFRSYVQTYIERDVRSLLAVHDLGSFRRFLALLASRHGQVLNRSDLAAPLGISVPTLTRWLSVLETTGHILRVAPFFESLGKRLIKAPKIYWVDPGLVCFLLGIDTQAALERSPFLGPVFEGLVASEIVKNQINSGRRAELYHFRDQQGLEVDFIVPAKDGAFDLVEVKWTRTVEPAMARSIQRLATGLGKRRWNGWIVTRGPTGPSPGPGGSVAPGVRTAGVEEFLGVSGASPTHASDHR